MTDKQIIDGIDVSGCEYYNKEDKTCREVNGNYDTDICEFDKCENSNCHYKNWKRKEQTCKVLALDAKVADNHLQHRIEMCDLLREKLKAKEQECEELKKNVEHWEMEHKEAKAKDEWTYDLVKKRLGQQLDQLKTENDTLRQFLSKEPLALQALQSGYTSYKKSSDVFYEMIKQYKQTLVEIKEIAEEQMPYMNIAESKTMIEIEYDYAGNIYNLEQRMDKILQKIREVME